jgi:hypothetical protein
MLVPYRLEIDGVAEVSRAFQVMAEDASDLSEPFHFIGGLILQAVTEQYDTQGAHGLGTRWAALSPQYAKWKEQHFPGKPILEATGAMRRSTTSPQAVTVTSRQLVYEPDDPKAVYHQRGNGHLPQRRIVALSGSDRRKWDRVFLTWIRHREGRAQWPPNL